MNDLTDILSVVENLTSIGILLLWLRAERSDSAELWSIIRDLIRLRLSQVEHDDITAMTKNSYVPDDSG